MVWRSQLFVAKPAFGVLALVVFCHSAQSQSSQTSLGDIPLRFGLPADEATRQRLYD
jgi:hypothetical protein